MWLQLMGNSHLGGIQCLLFSSVDMVRLTPQAARLHIGPYEHVSLSSLLFQTLGGLPRSPAPSPCPGLGSCGLVSGMGAALSVSAAACVVHAMTLLI